jgi:hypothetical protein
MAFKARLKKLLAGAVPASKRRGAKHLYYSTLHGNDLPRLATGFGSDKEGGHFYTTHYQRHFGPWRDRKLNLLEIGIGGYDYPDAGGESLRMWKAFFPHGHIFGIDLHDKSLHDEDRIKTFKGDQSDEAFLKETVRQIGPVDIIIDDGSHLNRHVIKTFQVLFPLLAPNGIYAVEDLQTAYWVNVAGQLWDGSPDRDAPHTSMAFLKRLADGLNYEEFTAEGYNPTYFDTHIVAMHFYHNLAFIYKGVNNEGSNFLGRRFRDVPPPA